MFEQIEKNAKIYFPNLQIKFKTDSKLMKFLEKVLFFNKGFMTDYITTVGDDIYFASKEYIKKHPIAATVALLHELVHVYDSHKYSQPIFSFLYLGPQILAILSLPLLLVSWKLSLLCLLFTLPIPSYFRMYFEKRAYIASLYALQKLSKKIVLDPRLDAHKKMFLTQFHGPSYYYMWPFKNIDKEFEEANQKIKNNERPFNDKIFDIIDDLINKI